MIVSLGEWVLDEALRQVAQWQREQALSVAVAVNVSPAQLGLQRPMKWIMAALRRHDLPPEMLEMEMTESAVMQEVDSVVGALRGLTRQVVTLAVDYFGTGHSNLSRPGLLPITSIKIDRSLITSIATQPKDAAIMRAVIEIAHTLGAQVVAEGVETAQQLTSSIDCARRATETLRGHQGLVGASFSESRCKTLRSIMCASLRMRLISSSQW